MLARQSKRFQAEKKNVSNGYIETKRKNKFEYDFIGKQENKESGLLVMKYSMYSAIGKRDKSGDQIKKQFPRETF